MPRRRRAQRSARTRATAWSRPARRAAAPRRPRATRPGRRAPRRRRRASAPRRLPARPRPPQRPLLPPPPRRSPETRTRPCARGRRVGSVLYLDGRLRRHARVQLLRKEKTRERSAQPPQHSLLRLGYNCWSIARAERVAFLVDAKDYFEAFYRAALLAQRSILVLAWDFNSQTRLHHDPVARDGPPALLGEFLNYITRRRRGLRVHVLNWDYPMVFGTDREFPPIYGLGGWTPARRVHLRYDDTHPIGASQHQKIVVIDDAIAFCGGIDLTVRRWDCAEHAPQDPRRTAYEKPYPPFHDTMIAVDGDAARQLGELARERWRLATGQRLRPVAVDADPWPAELEPSVAGVDVGIARTMPPRGELPAVREVEKLYLDMIATARRTIYIENQYFTAPRIAAAQ